MYTILDVYIKPLVWNYSVYVIESLVLLIIICFLNEISVTNLTKDLILYNKVLMDHGFSLCRRKGTNMITFCLIVFSILKKIVRRYILSVCQCAVKGTLMQIWKSGNIFVFTWKLYAEDFTLKRFTFCNMRTWSMWKFCLQSFRNNMAN